MKYLVTRMTIGCSDYVEISRDQFNEVKRARQGISQALSIEENFDILCENYYEFEKELLDIRLRNTMFSGNDWGASQSEIFLVERRIINVLTTSRLYLDQLCHAVRSFYGDSALEALNRRKSEQYDAKLGYRAVEAIRNFVQHRGLIVASLSLTASVTKADADRVVKRTITPSLSVGRIKKIGEFKASILKELESLGETMDLKPLIREAMEGYALVHAFARELSAKNIIPWERSISNTRKAYTDKFGDDEFVLSVSEVDDAGKTQESVVIFEDFVKRRKSLEEKNRTDISYNSQIVSSES